MLQRYLAEQILGINILNSRRTCMGCSFILLTSAEANGHLQAFRLTTCGLPAFLILYETFILTRNKIVKLTCYSLYLFVCFFVLIWKSGNKTNKNKLTRSDTMSRMRFWAPSTQSLAPLMMTLVLDDPLRGKLTVTPPYSSPISRRTWPRRATKWRWNLVSTSISASVMLSCKGE